MSNINYCQAPLRPKWFAFVLATLGQRGWNSHTLASTVINETTWKYNKRVSNESVDSEKSRNYIENLFRYIGKSKCGKRKGGGVVVFCLGPPYQQQGQNRAKRLQPPPLSVSGPVSVSFIKCRFTKCQINHDRNCISLQYLMRNINEHHQPLDEFHISDNKG